MYVYICILKPHVQLKIEADHFFFLKRAWNQLTPFSSSCIVCRQTWTPDLTLTSSPIYMFSIWSWKSKGALISVLSLYWQAEYTTHDPFYTIETRIILGITAAQNHMGLCLSQSITLPQAFCVVSTFALWPNNHAFSKRTALFLRWWFLSYPWWAALL